MKRRPLVICALGLLVAACATAPAVDRGQPDQFVRSLYPPLSARYENEEAFSDRLAALIDEDLRLAGDDDLPFMNYDPICNCQDWEASRLESVTTAPDPDGTVAATATLDNLGYKTRIVFRLRREHGGWRIDDVTGPEGGSLAQGLERSNRATAAQRAGS